jgi:hypothetical protein
VFLFSFVINFVDEEMAIQLGIAFISAIMKSYEDIPNSFGMKVLRGVPGLESDATIDLVIRNITEDFWKETIRTAETPNKRYRVCAVGTPGIGKTSSTPILIRLLLLMQRTVVYHVQTQEKVGWVYEFTPGQATEENPCPVVVNVIPEAGFSYKMKSLKQTKGLPNYYIVDPGNTIDNCVPDGFFKGRFILVSSPDDRHWGESQFAKENGATEGTFRYFPLWSLDELLAARPYLNNDISDNEVKQRYNQVGGVPRHVYTTSIDKVLTIQETAINLLTPNQVMAIVKTGWNAVSTFSQPQPRSALMGYGWSGNKYTVVNAVPISDRVLEKIFVLRQKELWEEFEERYNLNPAVSGTYFEAVSRNAMLAHPFSTYRKELLGAKNKFISQVNLGGCCRIDLIPFNLIDAANRTENVLYHPISKQYELVDFVYRKDNLFFAFQVTVRKDKRNANATKLRKFANDVGGPQNLQLYYLVPSKTFENFSTNPVNPVKDIKILIQQDIDQVEEDMKKLQQQNNGETDDKCVEQLQERLIQLQTELNATWSIYCAMIKNPNESYDAYIAKSKIAK